MDGLLAPGLGDSQRAILEHLKSQRERALGELEGELDLARETLRDHMKGLTALGLVERSGLRRRGAGRPEVLYRLTTLGEELFPGREGELLRELAAFLLERGHGEFLETFFQQRVVGKRESMLGRVRGLQATERLRVVAEMLTGEGFRARVTGTEAGEPRLCICHCAFRKLVDVSQLPCQAEMALLGDLLGGHLKRESFIPDGDAACTYTVTFSGEGPVQEAVAGTAELSRTSAREEEDHH